jgi:hypothetical protein
MSNLNRTWRRQVCCYCHFTDRRPEVWKVKMVTQCQRGRTRSSRSTAPPCCSPLAYSRSHEAQQASGVTARSLEPSRPHCSSQGCLLPSPDSASQGKARLLTSVTQRPEPRSDDQRLPSSWDTCQTQCSLHRQMLLFHGASNKVHLKDFFFIEEWKPYTVLYETKEINGSEKFIYTIDTFT